MADMRLRRRGKATGRSLAAARPPAEAYPQFEVVHRSDDDYPKPTSRI